MNWDDLPVSKDQVTVLALVAALVASAVLAPAMAGLGGPDLESGQVNTETPDATEAPREGTSYTASSDGMDDVPESYVANDIGGVVAPNVSTSAGSQTMQVDASGTADRPQLTLTDNQNHEGRVVAIDVAWFRQTLGEVPELAYVRHESGNTYASPISVEGGKAKFAVHEFSTNTVTFSGTFDINATPAQDGDKFTYDSPDGGENLNINVTGSTAEEWDNETASGVLSDHTTSLSVGGNVEPTDGAAGDPILEVTGQRGSAPYDSSAAALSQTVNISANAQNPAGVAFNGDGTKMFVQAGGDVKEFDLSTAYDPSSKTYSKAFDLQTQDSFPEGVAFNDVGSKMYVVGTENANAYEYDLSTAYDIGTASYSQSFNVSSEDGSPQDITFSADGSKMYVIGENSNSVHEYDLMTAFDIGTASYSQSVDVSTEESNSKGVKFNDDGSKMYITGSGSDSVHEYDLSTAFDVGTASLSASTAVDAASPSAMTFNGSGSKMYVTGYSDDVIIEYDLGYLPTGVDVSDGDGHTHSFGNFTEGETKTATLNLQTSSTELNFTGTDGEIDYVLTMQERTQTVDPVVDVNGDTTTYSGALADGETVTLSANDSWIVAGTNNVTATAGDGTLSSDAPTSEVGLDYTHDVVDDQSVDYTAEAWSERYQVSKTWAEDTNNATLRIPWASDRVVGLRDITVEYYDDTGSLSSSTTSPSYHFDGGDLVVELGDVPAGWETVVDADGTKVQVQNGNITVLEPTPQGSTLDSKIKIDDKSSGFYVAVEGTAEGSQVHYLHNESWSGADGYAEFDATGNQHVYMPNAAGGSETRLRTLPIEFSPVTGDIHVRIPEDRVNENEPVYKASPGASDGDEYSVTFVEAADGEDYVLYDETNGLVLDSGTASSPLTLSDDNDDEAIIQFELDDSSTTSSDGGGSSGEGGAGIFDGGDSRNTGFLIVVAVVLAVLAFIARGDESPVREAGDDIADSVEGASERVPVIGPLVGGVVASATRAVSQGASALLNNRDAAVLLGAGVVLGAIQTGVIDLGPQDTAIVAIVIASLGSLIGLRRLDEFTFKRWTLVNVIVGVVALQAVGEEAVLTAIVNSDVFPLIAAGGVVLLYLTIKGFRESQKEPDQNIVIQANTESDD